MPTNYTIKSGDTLSGIALKNGTTVSALMSANPTITNANKIYSGASIVLPGSTGTTIQNTTAQRGKDLTTQVDYNNIMASKGLNTPQTAPVPTDTTKQNTKDATQTTPTNPNGMIDSLYLSGVTDAGSILKQTGGTLDLDTINKRLATLNADPVYKANSDITSKYNKQLADLDAQRVALDEQMATLKADMAQENKSAMDSITATFANRRNVLQQSYSTLMQNREKSGYQTDAFRYTGKQMEGLISNDEQNHIIKLSELDAQEKALLLEAAKAKSEKDWDALSKSNAMYKSIDDQRKQVLGDLLKVSVENNKKITADQKIEQNALVTSAKSADAIAETVAKELSGLSGTAYNDKLQEYATKYNINPDALKSSVVSAQTKMTKDNIAINKGNIAVTKAKTGKTTAKGKLPSLDKEIGNIVLQVQEQMRSKGWAGMDKTDYDTAYNYLMKNYGGKAVKQLRDTLDNEGISY